MYKLMFFGVAAMSAAGAASAQTADAPTWSGPYAGIHAGYGIDGDAHMDISGTSTATNNAIASGTRPRAIGQDREGFVGGGQIGWNFQRGNWVFGPEGDFSYMRTRGTNSVYTNATGGGVQETLARSRMEWMGSARLRAGHTLGNGLVYATGGYAFGKVKGSATFNTPTGVQNYAGRNSYTAQGWTAGGGAEFRPFHEGNLQKVSFGIEATYYDLGRSHIYNGGTNAATINSGAYVIGRDTRGYNGVVKVNYAF